MICLYDYVLCDLVRRSQFQTRRRKSQKKGGSPQWRPPQKNMQLAAFFLIERKTLLFMFTIYPFFKKDEIVDVYQGTIEQGIFTSKVAYRQHQILV